jgi:hypothetical protein
MPLRGALHTGHLLSSLHRMRWSQVRQSLWLHWKEQTDKFFLVRPPTAMASRHTGHSSPSFSSARARFDMAARAAESTKQTPAGMDLDARKSYVAIAERQQAEGANGYTVLALGLQSYMSSRRVMRTSLLQPPPLFQGARG